MSRMKSLRFIVPPCIVLCQLGALETLCLLQRSCLLSTLHPQYQQGRRNIDRGVGSRDDTHQQCCREVTNWSSTHYEQNQHGEKRRKGRVERPHPRLCDRSVCKLIERFFRPIAQLLADTVHDHDTVLHRVGNDRKESADKGCIERNPENGQDAEGNKDVMHHAENRCKTE